MSDPDSHPVPARLSRWPAGPHARPTSVDFRDGRHRLTACSAAEGWREATGPFGMIALNLFR
jgi:hypothetical protein